MKSLKELTVLDCEYLYKFMNICSICSDGKVKMLQSENFKEGEIYGMRK